MMLCVPTREFDWFVCKEWLGPFATTSCHFLGTPRLCFNIDEGYTDDSTLVQLFLVRAYRLTNRATATSSQPAQGGEEPAATHSPSPPSPVRLCESGKPVGRSLQDQVSLARQPRPMGMGHPRVRVTCTHRHRCIILQMPTPIRVDLLITRHRLGDTLLPTLLPWQAYRPPPT